MHRSRAFAAVPEGYRAPAVNEMLTCLREVVATLPTAPAPRAEVSVRCLAERVANGTSGCPDGPFLDRSLLVE